MRSSSRLVLTTGLFLAATGLTAPAHAGIPIPVECSVDKVVLPIDDATYDLSGTCGVVVVTADNAEVTMPASQRLVVRGHGNSIHAKPIDQLVVRGHDQVVDATSVRKLRAASPGSTVRVKGLLEDARIAKRGLTLTARQINDLAVKGRGHDIAAVRGYDALLAGDGTDATFRRLDRVVLTGDHNAVTVKRGATEVRNSGSDNRIRVNRRG